MKFVWKKINWQFPVFCSVLSGLLLMLSACQTDYSDFAVEKAREYALENLRGVSETQRNFIRYTQPQIFENTIFPRMTMAIPEQGHIKINKPEKLPQAPGKDFMHSCVVWESPELGAMVVVSGAGERSMRGWKPNHLQVKNYVADDRALKKALKTCAEYALNNMPDLSAAELNRIRFSNPSFYYTVLPVKNENDTPQIQWGDEAWSASGKAENMEVQYSLVWPADSQDSRIVFTGYTKTGGIQQWQFAAAELMTIEKLEQNQLPEERHCPRLGLPDGF